MYDDCGQCVALGQEMKLWVAWRSSCRGLYECGSEERYGFAVMRRDRQNGPCDCLAAMRRQLEDDTSTEGVYMISNATAPVAVLGAGSFGTAISWLLSSAGENVRLWAFMAEEAAAINAEKRNQSFLSHCELDNVWATNSVVEAVEGCRAVIIATPSFGVMGVAEQMAGIIPDDMPVLILSKGLDLSGERPLVDAVAECIGGKGRVAVLSGPNHAEELSRGALAGAVIACENIETAKFFQQLLARDYFRLYASDDPLGVSLCGAAKNVIAIACGIARGAGFGDNTVALLMTRGLAEITRLVIACGGKHESCLGLAGVGDLIVTCGSTHSRNGMYGEAFAREGISVADYEARRKMVVEGAHAIEPMLKLAAAKGVEMPITCAVRGLLNGTASLAETSAMLMERDLKAEMLR